MYGLSLCPASLERFRKRADTDTDMITVYVHVSRVLEFVSQNIQLYLSKLWGEQIIQTIITPKGILSKKIIHTLSFISKRQITSYGRIVTEDCQNSIIVSVPSSIQLKLD